MASPTNYRRSVLALDDGELEQFVRQWVQRKASSYTESAMFSGAGDLGRDVVGYLSPNLHQGAWHNFQCKQYAKRLSTSTALFELGKIFYHADQGQFTLPTEYKFVAPRGVNRKFEKLVFNPSLLSAELIANWDQYCASSIVSGLTIALNGTLLKLVQDFQCKVSRIDIDDLLIDPDIKPVLHAWFGWDPGPAPKGIVPISVETLEIPYINELVAAYAERHGVPFANYAEACAIHKYKEHLASQRERFYDAEAFQRFYRDNTNAETIREFSEDIYSGVKDVCYSNHADAFECVNAVMSQAAAVQAAGPLAPHARVQVKQGMCHHFANVGRLKWKQ